MKRGLILALALCACAPSRQPVQVWEGSGRVLLRDQHYRLTFTVNDQTHDLRGQLLNKTSGDIFQVSGTFLPVAGAAELTAQVTAGSGVKLNASLLGFGISGIGLKSDAMLVGHVVGPVFSGSLRVNGIEYPISLTRTQ